MLFQPGVNIGHLDLSYGSNYTTKTKNIIHIEGQSLSYSLPNRTQFCINRIVCLCTVQCSVQCAYCIGADMSGTECVFETKRSCIMPTKYRNGCRHQYFLTHVIFIVGSHPFCFTKVRGHKVRAPCNF